ncbi:hypothetical protein Droror1_Dr00011000 [Drosera rotundifolia]
MSTTSSDYSQPIFPTLLNDISLQILARIPLSHHPTLSLVSKPFHTTLTSPHLHLTRRLLHLTRPHLLLFLRLPPNSDYPSLHFLLIDPKTLNPLIRVIKTPFRNTIGASIVGLGSRVYVIGGSVDDVATNSMWVYDIESNEWGLGEEMRVKREFAACGVVDGKVYVMGGCVANTRAKERNWAEVYDPVERRWGGVECELEVKEGLMHSSVVIEGKVYGMADRGGVVYDPRGGEWGIVSKRLDNGWRGRATVVDGVLYCYDYLGKIRGFDSGKDVWRELKGVEKGLPRFLCGATLVNVDGRLFVVWEEKGNGKVMEVMCAEIEVKKEEDGGGLSGKIVWSGVVAVVPFKSSIVNCLAVAL